MVQAVRISTLRKCSALTMDLSLSIYYTIPDTAFQVILRFVGAHNLEVIWRCIACNPYWYGWYCPGCKTPLRFLHWTPRSHFGYCGPRCGCCRTVSGLDGCLICHDLKSWKVTSRDARELLRHFNGLWCLWQFGYPFLFGQGRIVGSCRKHKMTVLQRC